MRYAVSLILALALLGSGYKSFSQITEEKSDITGIRRVESKDMRPLYDKRYSGSDAFYRAEYVHDPDDGTSWIFTIYGVTEDTTAVTRSSDFLVNVEGEKLKPLRLQSKTREIDGSLLEIKRAFFTRSDFETIATSKSEVSFSIGSFQFVAIHPRRKDMRLILDRIPADSSSQTASKGDSSDRRR